MNEALIEILSRLPDSIQQEITALRFEIDSDMDGKSTYKYNDVLYKIALLNRDVQTLAMGIAEILERQDTHGAMLKALYELRALDALPRNAYENKATASLDVSPES